MTVFVKVCPRCEVPKLLSEFHRCRTRPNGVDTYCKPCQRELKVEARERRIAEGGIEAERARQRERVQQWRDRDPANRETDRAYKRAQGKAYRDLAARHSAEFELLLSLRLAEGEQREATS